VVVVDNGVQRRRFIKARIEAIRQELDELIRELDASDVGLDDAEQRRRKFKIVKGGLLALLLLSAGSVVSRYRKPLLAVTATAAASVVAVAVLGHGAPRGAIPPVATGPQPAMTRVSASLRLPSSRQPTSRLRPRLTSLVPVVPPTRLRRTPNASGARPSPLPSPTAVPSGMPSPQPSGSATPTTSRCAVAVSLDVLRVALKICV
jgi:hypothetical protein